VKNITLVGGKGDGAGDIQRLRRAEELNLDPGLA
jgi:hypothetical protein